MSIDNSGPVNHQGIYAQALALYRQGYRYWYEKEEVTFLNKRNESFRQKDPVEENLFSISVRLKAERYKRNGILPLICSLS